MTVLFDENVSHRLVEFLRVAGAPGSVQHVNKVGWRSKPDDVWIPLAIRNGWVIVSGDRNEGTRGLRAEDIKALGGQMLLLGSFWDHLSIWDKAKWLVANWERILDRIGTMSGGACMVIDRQGRTTRL